MSLKSFLSIACLFAVVHAHLLAGPVGVFEEARDIGAPPTAGSTTVNGSTYTMRASGDDIWDNGDQFQFAYKRLRGDFSCSLRIKRRDPVPAGSGQWGRHGLMARWSTDPDSKYSLVATMLPHTDTPGAWHPPQHQFRQIHRQAAPNSANYWVEDGTFIDEGRLPTWMRLDRVGNAIYSYLAEDADHDGLPDDWVLAGSDSTPYMPDELLVGAYLQAQSGANLGTIAFDNVSFIDNLKQPAMDCSIAQTVLSRSYDTGDPNALADASVLLCAGTERPRIYSPGRLRITTEVFNLSTAVWYNIPNSQLLSERGFIAEFDVFMSPQGDPDPADGMTFAMIQRGAEILAPAGVPDLCGEGYYNLGYGKGKIQERAEKHPSAAVEIDNWIIGGEPGNEPSAGGGQAGVGRYHIGLDVNGEVSSVQTNEDLGVPSHLLPDLFLPEGVHFWVQYFPDGNIDVYANSNKAPAATYHVISHHVPPFSGPMLIGFTGGTGQAWSIREVDNFTVRLTNCALAPPATLLPVVIDLGNITGGGDGNLLTAAPHIGVDPRNGRFTDQYFDGMLFNKLPGDPAEDGLNPSPGEGPYIDSAFFNTNRQSGEFIFPQDITQSGVKYKFPDYDAAAQGWNHILMNRVGGVSSPGVTVGPFSGFSTSVGIHSAMGITYDLDALRARHGWRNVRCFSTVWGLDSCAGGDADLIAIFANDAGVLGDKISRITSGGWESVRLPIPANARYLTLATGNRGANLDCDHGTFARAMITSWPCQYNSGESWIWRVEPTLVSTSGGQRLAVLGENLNTRDGYRVSGRQLTSLAVIPGPGGTSLGVSGVLPPLNPGYHDVDVDNLDDDGTGSVQLRSAFEAAPPVELTSVEPDAIINNTPTELTIRGKNFRAGVTRFELVGERGTRDIGATVVTATEARGVIPAAALPAGEPNGFKAVRALDARGNVTLSNAIQFLDASATVLTNVTPNLVLTTGGTLVTFNGNGFVSGATIPRLGGKPLTEVTFLGPTQLRGRTPSLAEGLHAAQLVTESGQTLASRPNAVEAAPPLTLQSVAPGVVLADGSTRVVVRGQSLRAETHIRIGDRELVNPVRAADKLSISGLAPALLAGEPLGPRDVVAVDPRGNVTLRNGVSYVLPAISTIPGPQELEGTLAEGTARFRWSNPMAYDEVVVRNAAGQTVSRLAGNATEFEAPAGNQAEVRLNFQGIARTGGSDVSEGLARKLLCSRPPPLEGEPVEGTLDFSVYGGSVAATVTGRCRTGGGGGGEPAVGPAARGSAGGSPQALNSTGYVVTNRDTGNDGGAGLTNVLVTGFTLEQDADKLEISAFYQKLIAEFGVSLRGRLVLVDPVGSGFTDEFTFPDILMNQPKAWNSITYFRADRDVVEIGANACGLKIPKGDYLLELYCVGGNAKLPYFVFADDGRDSELLIQGASCPPYPLAKVKDLTGYATLPDITKIEAKYIAPNGSAGHFVRFTARGSWIDEEGKSHPIHREDENPNANPPYLYVDDGFEYTFTIQSSAQPDVPRSNTNYSTLSMRDFGCFKIEVEVRDRFCGFTKKRTLEVAVFPPEEIVRAANKPFLFPAPDPNSVFGIVGLVPPPGNGAFSGRRPLDFRVLVVPQNCAGSIYDCRSPTIAETQFQLTYKQNNSSVLYYAIPAENIADLCSDVTRGPKYFKVSLDNPLNTQDDDQNDLGRLPARSAISATGFTDVHLQAKLANGSFQDVGLPMHLTRPPGILSEAQWTGSYDEPSDTYRFGATTSSTPTTSFDVEDSDEVALPLDGADAKIPSFSNSMNNGMTARFKMLRGEWSADDATGVSSGEMLGNKLDGAPARLPPSTGAGGGDGAGGAANQYEWCKAVTIFDNKLNQTLFDSVLFTGAIGPIPVTIWASIALAINCKVEALARVFLAPLEAFDGGKYFESDFYLLSKLDISIPCSIRADILFGIANITARLVPTVRTNFDVHLGAENLTFEKGLDLGVYFDLGWEIEACLDLPLLPELCYDHDEQILTNQKIVHSPVEDVPFCLDAEVRKCSTPAHDPYCTPPVHPLIGGAAGRGAGGVPTQKYIKTNAPVTVASPDGKTTLDSWIDGDGNPAIYVNANPTKLPQDQADRWVRSFRDPAAVFLSNSRALIAYTMMLGSEATLTEPRETDPSRPGYYTGTNLLLSQSEIMVWAVAPSFDTWETTGAPFRVADPTAEVPNFANRRADGRVAIAADLTAEQALLAWVRYDTPSFLLPEPNESSTIWQRQPDGTLQAVSMPTVRPQLRKTAIYSRRAGFSGLIGSRNMLRKVSEDRDGINIEPTIDCSPSGRTAYCVWINNPDDKDLLSSNRNRRLLFSVYDRSRDVDTPASRPWTAPASVILRPQDYPGLLEPSVRLRGDNDGLVAFTALDPGEASQIDSGLAGGTRYVYTCHLRNGVFDPPVRIHGKCLAREYGHWPIVMEEGLNKVVLDPQSRLNRRLPDYVAIIQGRDELTSLDRSGGIKVAVIGKDKTEFSLPVTVNPGNVVRTNVTGTMTSTGLHTVSLNQGPALPALGLGGGAGVGSEPERYEIIDIPLKPDLLVESCTLSDRFAGPGADVEAKVVIKNIGLSGSAYDSSGRSAVGVQAVFIDPTGHQSVVAVEAVPELQPGDQTIVQLEIEMPLDPVMLRVELNPNPLDADPANDSKLCFFGAPAPRDAQCIPISLRAAGDLPSAQVSWEPAAIYDEVRLYRDGVSLAVLPATARTFIDLHVEPGLHEYAVQGVIGASKSRRSKCEVRVGVALFRRGDADSNGNLDISDGIFTLNYLFSGGPAPTCAKAADSDDTGTLDLSDAIVTLGYLFLGSRPPAFPHPNCGEDLTADDLDCEAQSACR